MESHKRTLGILLLVLAFFQVLIMVFFNFVIRTIFTFAMGQAEPDDAHAIEMVMSLLQYLPAIIIIFFSIPSIIAGIGLLNNKSWAMLLALIIGIIHILSFPIGTAIGIYSIWIYSEENKLKKKDLAAV